MQWVKDALEYCARMEQAVLKMHWLLNSGQGNLASQLLSTVAAEAETRNISGQVAADKVDHPDVQDTATRHAGRLH